MSNSKQYKRTCTKCDTMWYVPKDFAEEKMPTKQQVRGAKMMSLGTGSLWGVGRLGQSQSASYDAQAQRVLDNSRCPNCGPSTYSQSKEFGVVSQLERVSTPSSATTHRSGSLPPGTGSAMLSH